MLKLEWIEESLDNYYHYVKSLLHPDEDKNALSIDFLMFENIWEINILGVRTVKIKATEKEVLKVKFIAESMLKSMGMIILNNFKQTA